MLDLEAFALQTEQLHPNILRDDKCAGHLQVLVAQKIVYRLYFLYKVKLLNFLMEHSKS